MCSDKFKLDNYSIGKIVYNVYKGSGEKMKILPTYILIR